MNNVETTLRAVVDGRRLATIRLPEPVEVTSGEAMRLAAWARPFAAICLVDIDIMVSDIRPSTALKVMSDLETTLARRLKPVFELAHAHGFGVRLQRETAFDPYVVEVVRRVVDAPQLTITARAMGIFLDALGYGHSDLMERRIAISAFEQSLATHKRECLDAGVGHYHAYAQRIAEYGRDNEATEIVWGPERRGAVAEAA